MPELKQRHSEIIIAAAVIIVVIRENITISVEECLG
jgi:hypothetical protein